MSLYLYKFISKTFLTNFLFCLIPISFIAGNLIINLNIVLIILFSFMFYGNNMFKIKYDLLDKLVLIFFSYILLIGFFNNVFDKTHTDYTVLIKSILYLRFLILYFIIRFLTSEKIINYKYFFYSCSLSSIFVCLDLIYQFKFGQDIFGFEGLGGRRLSGPFGDEYIAGSYLQRFAFFSFFALSFIKIKKSEKIFPILSTLLLFLIFFSLVVAGNRIPLIMFLFMIITFLVLEKKTRKYLLYFLTGSTIIFLTIFNLNPSIKSHFKMFKAKTFEFVVFFSTILIEDKQSALIVTKDGYSITSDKKLISELQKKQTTTHDLKKDSEINLVKNSEFINVNGKIVQIPNTYIKEFNSGYQTWQKKKYFGGGVRSFKYNCPKTGLLNCGPHPHNYYLEILAELGLLGFFFLVIIFLIIFYNTFIKRYFLRAKVLDNKMIVPFLFLFFIEIFPVKTTGSFFSSGNSTYIFLFMAIIVALSKDKKFN